MADLTLTQLKTRLTALPSIKSLIPFYMYPMYSTDHNDGALQQLISSKLGGITLFPHEYYAGGYNLPISGVDWGIMLQPQQFVTTPVTSATIDAGYRTIFQHLQYMWRRIIEDTEDTGTAEPTHFFMDFEGDTYPLLARLQKMLEKMVYGIWPNIKQNWYGAGQAGSVHVPSFVGDFQGIVSYYPDVPYTTDSIFQAAQNNVGATGSSKTKVGVWQSLDYSNNTGVFGNNWLPYLHTLLGVRMARLLNTKATDSQNDASNVPAEARNYDRMSHLVLYDHDLPPATEAWHLNLRNERILTPLENFVRGVKLGWAA